MLDDGRMAVEDVLRRRGMLKAAEAASPKSATRRLKHGVVHENEKPARRRWP
jgi:hypothetical protein